MTHRRAVKQESTISLMLEAPDTASGRLLLAAIRLFGAKGYAATSVRDIVRSAGVTAPTLYYHFGNKEGLCLSIVRAGRAHLEQCRRTALEAGGPAAERIRRLSRMHFELRRESAHLAWAIERIMTDPVMIGLSSEFRALASDSIRQFEVLVEEGVSGGEFCRCLPRHVALALAGAISIASRPYLTGVDLEQSEKELEGMLTVILAGIARATSGGIRGAPDDPPARRTGGSRQSASRSRKRG